MKAHFRGYYLPSPEEFDEIWKNGLFVLDTNVLLNLYSYPEAVRGVFLSVLEKLAPRIWIPYQVALEFHRNKFSRIKQANSRVEKLLQTIEKTGREIENEVRSIELEKRNIGISDIQQRLDAVLTAHKGLSEAVRLACDRLPAISLNDAIGSEISELIADHIGPAPASQEDLDELIQDGDRRFDRRIPPGFSDIKKEGEIYRDRGIVYQAKFGDLILWKQIIEHAKINEIKSIALITGDKKEDWWWKEGEKTIGPLPELAQEIFLQSNVEHFWMYSSDQFLSNAETHLKANEVTEDTIQQIRDFTPPRLANPSQEDMTNLIGLTYGEKTPSFIRNNLTLRELDLFDEDDELRNILSDHKKTNVLRRAVVERVISSWLKDIYPTANILIRRSPPDFIVSTSTSNHGYFLLEEYSINSNSSLSLILSILNTSKMLAKKKIDRATILLVASKNDIVEIEKNEATRAILVRNLEESVRITSSCSIILGEISEGKFTPHIIVQDLE